jgi:hypothetical protein
MQQTYHFGILEKELRLFGYPRTGSHLLNYRVERDRWNSLEKLSVEWVRGELSGYAGFYDKAFEVLDRQGDRGMLLRWEELVAGPWPLERLVRFVGLVPKLRCSYVWSVTRFENFVKPGNRTFYRSGKNDAWKIDPEWVQLLSQMKDFSFERFGYLTVVDYTPRAGGLVARLPVRKRSRACHRKRHRNRGLTRDEVATGRDIS